MVSGGDHGKDREFAERLHFQSEYWPDFVNLTEEISLNGKAIQEGTRVILIRVEKEKVLLDFGRNGLHRLDFDQTNLIKLAQAQSQRTLSDLGNLTEILSRSVTMVKAEEVVEGKRADFAWKNFVLLIYGNPKEGEVKELLASCRELDSTLARDLRVVLIPLDSVMREVAPLLRELEYESPVMLPFLAKAYSDSWDHGYEGKPLLVLVDRNGRILKKFTYEGNDRDAELNRFISEIPESLRRDPLRNFTN